MSISKSMGVVMGQKKEWADGEGEVRVRVAGFLCADVLCASVSHQDSTGDSSPEMVWYSLDLTPQEREKVSESNSVLPLGAPR